jgi:hypothetical protein
MRRSVIGLVGCIFLATEANAEATAKEFLSSPPSDLKEMLAGVLGLGFYWSNTFLEADGGKPMYCPPQKLAITSQQYMEILRQHVQENPQSGDQPAGYAMLLALRDTFPCP